MDLDPIGDNIVVRLDPKTPTGVDTAQPAGPYKTGKILAVGPGYWNSAEGKHAPMQVAGGPRVIVSGYVSEMEFVGEKLVIAYQSEILAVIVE